jgi:hypothetical protein
VYSEDNVQVCLCRAENCRGILGPTTLQPKKKSTTSKAMDSVKAAVKGVKRKAREMIGLEDDDDSDSEAGNSRQKRRRIMDPRAMLSKVGQQISNVSSGSEPAVQPISEQELTAQKQSREDRALKRSASLITLNSRVAGGRVTKSRSTRSSFHVSEIPKAKKTSNRRSTSALRAPSPSPYSAASELRTPVRVSPRVKAPKSRIHDLKDGIMKRGEDLFKAALGSFAAGDAISRSSLPRTKSHGSDQSSMRQARLSFAPTGSLGLKVSPEKAKPVVVEEEMAPKRWAGGPQIPKRGSSLTKTTAGGRARNTGSAAKSEEAGAK